MRHLRQKIVGIIPIIQMIISAGGTLDAKDRLERRKIDIAVVHARIEIYRMLMEDTEDPLSEVTHERSGR